MWWLAGICEPKTIKETTSKASGIRTSPQDSYEDSGVLTTPPSYEGERESS